MASTTTPAQAGRDRAGLGQAVLAEWTKLRSVGSTTWALLALVALTVGLSAFACSAHDTDAGALTDNDTVMFSVSGVYLSQIAVVWLAVLSVGPGRGWAGGVRRRAADRQVPPAAVREPGLGSARARRGRRARPAARPDRSAAAARLAADRPGPGRPGRCALAPRPSTQLVPQGHLQHPHARHVHERRSEFSSG